MIHTESPAQEQAVLDLVRWFDNESSSLHHALVMAAEHNEADARQVDETYPVVAQVLRESASRWLTHAQKVLDLTADLGDTRAIDENHPF
jgi:hypothetical protein